MGTSAKWPLGSIMIRAQAIVLVYLACSVYGQTQTQRARGSLPLATLNSFCPCSVRQFCNNIFEGEDAIFTEILQSIPACPLDQVRCCTKNSMFTAITTESRPSTSIIKKGLRIELGRRLSLHP